VLVATGTGLGNYPEGLADARLYVETCVHGTVPVATRHDDFVKVSEAGIARSGYRFIQRRKSPFLMRKNIQ
jgi:hypothetical protein